MVHVFNPCGTDSVYSCACQTLTACRQLHWCHMVIGVHHATGGFTGLVPIAFEL